MKSLLSLSLLLMSLISNATDFYVAESFDNTNNKFNTINAAIAAANDGDRIYIQDKPGAGYVEDLTINKSLSLINMNNNERFTVTGDIGIHNNKSIIIIGIDLDGSLNTTNAYCKVFNSRLESLISSLNLLLVNSTISRMSFSNGTAKLFGNSILWQSSIDATPDYTTTLKDTILLCGNIFRYTAFVYNKYANIIIKNNMFIQKDTTIINPLYKHCIFIKEGDYEISNNTFYNFDKNLSQILIGDNQTWTNISLKDNVFINNDNNSYAIEEEYGTHRNIYSISNNFYTHASFFKDSLQNDVDYSGSNQLNAQLLIDLNTFITTGDNINAGDPDPLMSDLDLTRNDAGCYGGPYSFSNYFPQNDNGARVYWIDMPRRFFTGSTINIKAYGVDK